MRHCASSRRLGRALLTVLSIGLIAEMISAQQPHKVLAPHDPIAPKAEKTFALEPSARAIAGGPWIVDANFQATVFLKNIVQTSAVTVTPVLHLSNGAKYPLAPVQLEASGIATVDINSSLEKLGIAPYATLSGWVELQYNWPWDPLCAMLRDLDTTHSVIFTFGFGPPESLKPNSLHASGSQVTEGMWWKQEPNVSSFVALANTTLKPITAVVDVSDNASTILGSYTVTVTPQGMKTVDLRELQTAPTNEGGIRVTYIGEQDGLLISGGLQDVGVGYSANLPFSPPPPPPPPGAHPTPQQGITELGLMTGAADPMMNFPAGTVFTPFSVLRNASSGPIAITPTVWWMQNGAPASFQLPQFSLSPYATRTLNVPSLLAAAGFKNTGTSMNLVFDTQGQQGLILAAGSVDQKNTYVFEVAPRAVATSAAKSLSYWSTAKGDDTMVNLWNPADEDQDFIFRIMFPGGHYDLPLHLAARVARTFNISELIANQAPDAAGNVIPAGLQQGSALIVGSQADNQHILVVMDAGIYNVRKATCGGSCQNCDGATTYAVYLAPFDVNVFGWDAENYYSNYCSGTQYNLTQSSTWSSSNTSIFTIPSPGQVHGVSPGSATLNVFNNTEPVCAPQCNPYGSCPAYTGGGASAPGNVVNVTVNSASLWNNQISVTLTGDSSVTGNLNLSLVGSASTYTFQYGSSAVGPGTYNVTMTRPNIPADTYNSIQATWSSSQGNGSGSLSIKWKVLGLIRHSQYNTPYENTCTGSAGTAWIINVSSCQFSQISLRSDFASQVYINGTGVSNSHGILKFTPGNQNQCSYPPGSDDSNTFLQVSSVTGSCNLALDNTSVATNPNPVTDITTFGCGDNLALITSSNTQKATKYPEDYCPACNTGFNGTNGHIDNYTTNQSCSGHSVGDYGNFWTADTYSSN